MKKKDVNKNKKNNVESIVQIFALVVCLWIAIAFLILTIIKLI